MGSSRLVGRKSARLVSVRGGIAPYPDGGGSFVAVLLLNTTAGTYSVGIQLGNDPAKVLAEFLAVLDKAIAFEPSLNNGTPTFIMMAQTNCDAHWVPQTQPNGDFAIIYARWDRSLFPLNHHVDVDEKYYGGFFNYPFEEKDFDQRFARKCDLPFAYALQETINGPSSGGP
jgi:hypothetical protein